MVAKPLKLARDISEKDQLNSIVDADGQPLVKPGRCYMS